jgi:hypothetical protein
VVRQVPRPSQRPANVSDELVHPACWQATPATYFSHAPAPSQNPSVSQVAAPRSGQSLRGSVPTSAGIQLPMWPAAAQVWHAAEQSVAQQNPSAQNADRQSPAELQE